MTELPRLLLEVSALSQTWPILSDCSKGDGHPVMLLPGFMASDTSTTVLRRFLDFKGYRPLPWQLGTNTGAPELVTQLLRHFYRIAQKEKQPITLIGQSLGGVFARELARHFPDKVRQVITLGSPFGASDQTSTNRLVMRLFEVVSGSSSEALRARVGTRNPSEPPPGVPCTSVYSKSDGVVHWRACLEQASVLTQNIEIVGSHTGMAMNPVVYHVIFDRLSLKPGEWQRFDRSKGLRRHFISATDAVAH